MHPSEGECSIYLVAINLCCTNGEGGVGGASQDTKGRLY